MVLNSGYLIDQLSCNLIGRKKAVMLLVKTTICHWFTLIRLLSQLNDRLMLLKLTVVQLFAVSFASVCQ